MDATALVFATLPRRIKAGIVDGMVMLILFIISPVLLGSLVGNDSRLSGLAMFLPPLLLEPVLITTLGFTVGQRLFGMRVVRASTGGKCPLPASFLRYAVKTLLGVLSTVYMLFTKHHQAIHDYAAGTLVVLSEDTMRRNPGLANTAAGFRDGESDTFVYPSAARRFTFFCLWAVVMTIVFGIVVEGTALLFLPGYTVETKNLPRELDVVIDGCYMISFVALAVRASRGLLPGAKRTRKSS